MIQGLFATIVAPTLLGRESQMRYHRPARVAYLSTGCFYVDDPLLVRIRGGTVSALRRRTAACHFPLPEYSLRCLNRGVHPT